MIKVRTLNELGTTEFASYIESLRAGGKEKVPKDILESPTYTYEFNGVIKLDSKMKFNNRYDMVSYLSRQSFNVDIEGNKSNIGLWNWLSLFWFDQICPSDDKSFYPRQNSLYLYSTEPRRRYKHLLYSSWLLVTRYDDLARIFLLTLDKKSDLQEQIMGRQEMWTSEAVVKLVNRLYSVNDKSGLKRGAGSKGPGSVRRLVDVLQQFECNYDLSSMKQDELLDLLPNEFDKFKNLV